MYIIDYTVWRVIFTANLVGLITREMFENTFDISSNGLRLDLIERTFCIQQKLFPNFCSCFFFLFKKNKIMCVQFGVCTRTDTENNQPTTVDVSSNIPISKPHFKAGSQFISTKRLDWVLIGRNADFVKNRCHSGALYKYLNEEQSSARSGFVFRKS